MPQKQPDADEPARVVYLVVTGAPLTRRVGEGVVLAKESGWLPAVVATDMGDAWLDHDELRTLDVPIVNRHRAPGAAKRLPPPEAIVLAPATFNTVNKLANGIADTYALSVLCEALGRRCPLFVVPFVSRNLAGHPAWPASLAVLRRAGVSLVDASTGRLDVVKPHEPGAGGAVADAFRWSWVFDHLILPRTPGVRGLPST